MAFSELHIWAHWVSMTHCTGEEAKQEAAEATESSGHDYDSEVRLPSSATWGKSPDLAKPLPPQLQNECNNPTGPQDSEACKVVRPVPRTHSHPLNVSCYQDC